MISLYNIEKILFITFLNHLGSTILIPHLQKKSPARFLCQCTHCSFLISPLFSFGITTQNWIKISKKTTSTSQADKGHQADKDHNTS